MFRNEGKQRRNPASFAEPTLLTNLLQHGRIILKIAFYQRNHFLVRILKEKILAEEYGALFVRFPKIGTRFGYIQFGVYNPDQPFIRHFVSLITGKEGDMLARRFRYQPSGCRNLLFPFFLDKRDAIKFVLASGFFSGQSSR